jgi:hypothetical protein
VHEESISDMLNEEDSDEMELETEGESASKGSSNEMLESVGE